MFFKYNLDGFTINPLICSILCNFCKRSHKAGLYLFFSHLPVSLQGRSQNSIGLYCPTAKKISYFISAFCLRIKESRQIAEAVQNHSQNPPSFHIVKRFPCVFYCPFSFR